LKNNFFQIAEETQKLTNVEYAPPDTIARNQRGKDRWVYLPDSGISILNPQDAAGGSKRLVLVAMQSLQDEGQMREEGDRNAFSPVNRVRIEDRWGA